MKRYKQPRLTLRSAKYVAEKVLGPSKGLYKDETVTNFDLYIMQMEMFSMRIQLDCYSGLISVWFASKHMLFDPVTLEENYKEEEIQERKARREEFDEWVDAHDPEWCKEQIDKSWNQYRG